MGQAKRKMESLPPGCVAPASYGRADWHFALAVTGDKAKDGALAKKIARALDSSRLIPSAFNATDPREEVRKEDLTVIDASREKAGVTLLIGASAATGKPDVIHRVPAGSAETEAGGIRMRPCTVDGLPAYAGEPRDVRTAVYEHIGRVLREPDGRALTDPLALCAGRLRWHDRPGRLYRADSPLTYQDEVGRAIARGGAPADELEQIAHHAFGFARTCEQFPCDRTRSIHAFADRRSLRAVALIDHRRDAVPLEDVRKLYATIYAARVEGRAHDALMAATTLADGETLRRDRTSKSKRDPERAERLLAAARSLAEAAGMPDGEIPPWAGCVQLGNESDEDVLPSPQLGPLRRYCRSLRQLHAIDGGDVAGGIHAIPGAGLIIILNQGAHTYVTYWDHP